MGPTRTNLFPRTNCKDSVVERFMELVSLSHTDVSLFPSQGDLHYKTVQHKETWFTIV